MSPPGPLCTHRPTTHAVYMPSLLRNRPGTRSRTHTNIAPHQTQGTRKRHRSLGRENVVLRARIMRIMAQNERRMCNEARGCILSIGVAHNSKIHKNRRPIRVIREESSLAHKTCRLDMASVTKNRPVH